MARLIDADALKAHYAWWQGGTAELTLDEAKRDFDTIIDLQPTVEAVPIKHGTWIRCHELRHTIDGRVLDGYSECSAYGELYPLFPEYNYCPNCGSDMRGGENKAHWITQEYGNYKCSKCGDFSTIAFKFCPTCKARMDGGENG